MVRKKQKTFLLIATIVLIVSGLHYVGVLSPVEQFLRGIIQPGSARMYQWGVVIDETERTFDSVEELEQGYRDLLEEHQQMQIDRAQFDVVKKENEQLRDLLDFQERSDLQLIGGSVVGKNIDPLGSTIILDIGEAQGVVVDQPVLVRDGIFVGRIIKVNEESSVVRLLDDNQSKIAATTVSAEQSIGVVEGGYGLSVRMNFIPQHQHVEIGAQIVSSGLEPGMPRGLLIGTIEAVEKEAYQPFQSAIITPAYNLDAITNVAVVAQTD